MIVDELVREARLRLFESVKIAFRLAPVSLLQTVDPDIVLPMAYSVPCQSLIEAGIPLHWSREEARGRELDPIAMRTPVCSSQEPHER